MSKKEKEYTEDDFFRDMDKDLDKMDEVECLSDYVTKAFEKEGYKQNNYWEYDEEGDVMFATFIDSNLDVVVVFFDGKLEFIEKENKKEVK